MVVRALLRILPFREDIVLDFGFYNADCMEHLKDYPDNYFDLAIVDPPYGSGLADEGGCKGLFSKYHQEKPVESGGGTQKYNRFGQRFDRYKNPQARKELSTIRRDLELSELVERGRANTEKNHNVGRSPGQFVFYRTFPRLTKPDYMGGQLL